MYLRHAASSSHLVWPLESISRRSSSWIFPDKKTVLQCHFKTETKHWNKGKRYCRHHSSKQEKHPYDWQTAQADKGHAKNNRNPSQNCQHRAYSIKRSQLEEDSASESKMKQVKEHKNILYLNPRVLRDQRKMKEPHCGNVIKKEKGEKNPLKWSVRKQAWCHA